MKILVVDDEYAFCKSIKEFLVRLGYTVIITTSGEHALDILREERPDVMTLDIRMPGMNGYEVLESIRKGGSVKVIVVSAIDIPEMEDKLIHAGAKAVLYKPVNLKLLAETVKTLSQAK